MNGGQPMSFEPSIAWKMLLAVVTKLATDPLPLQTRLIDSHEFMKLIRPEELPAPWADEFARSRERVRNIDPFGAIPGETEIPVSDFEARKFARTLIRLFASISVRDAGADSPGPDFFEKVSSSE